MLLYSSVCCLLQVKSDCEPKLASLKVPWPLNCSRLPESNDKEQLCMAPEILQNPFSSPYIASKHSQNQVTPSLISPGNPSETESTSKDMLKDSCSDGYVKYDNSTCSNLCQPSCKDCVPKCGDVLFTQQHKEFTYAVMAVLASLCIVSTLCTIVTFCIEPSRFKYPTRPIIFMAFCYLMYAVAHFIRLFIPAKDIICKADPQDPQGHSLQILYGMDSTLCILMFLIQYYFITASHIWWLVLTLTWYLAASRKWSLEALNSIACYFHLFTWAIPAVLTIAILVTGKVDSNELTGMCFVGNHDRWALLLYVIIPFGLLLVVGVIFLLAGFAALLQIRTNLKTQEDGANIRKLEKLMAKIGIFAILYTVSSVCVLGAYMHESLNIDAWRCLAQNSQGELSDSIPTVEIFILKIAMSLLVGVVISMWVLSSKTIKSCEKKCCRKRSNAPQLCHYTKHPTYMMRKSIDGSSNMQHHSHYRFHSRHTLLSSHYSPSSIGPQQPEPVNL